jgi:hypothetical protein
VLLMDRYWSRERAMWGRWPDEVPARAPDDTVTRPAGKGNAA